ncbi:hypothetical protein PENTCL1PPCAC_3572, partial [Pristionchus entomophagus]
ALPAVPLRFHLFNRLVRTNLSIDTAGSHATPLPDVCARADLQSSGFGNYSFYHLWGHSYVWNSPGRK